MKDITLRITGRSIQPDQNEDEVLQFTTQGTLQQRGSVTRISYPESELSGMEGCTTNIILSANKMKMTRTGFNMENPTVLEFQIGKRYEGLYETPYGPVGVEVLTNSISGFEPNENGSKKLTVDYNVSLHGLMESRNLLDIEILSESESGARH